MSKRPATGASSLARRILVSTTRTIARANRIVEMMKGIGSVCRILIRLGARLIELGRQPVEQRVDLTGPVPTKGSVEPQRTQVVSGDRTVGRETYVGPVVVRRAKGVAAPGGNHRDRPHHENDQNREEPGHRSATPSTIIATAASTSSVTASMSRSASAILPSASTVPRNQSTRPDQ